MARYDLRARLGQLEEKCYGPHRVMFCEEDPETGAYLDGDGNVIDPEDYDTVVCIVESDSGAR